MAQRTASRLDKKTRAVYDEVVHQEKEEAGLDALKRAEEVVSRAGSVDEIRKSLDVEKAHLQDVIKAKAKLQETVGSLIAGYDALTNSLGGEIEVDSELGRGTEFIVTLPRTSSEP